jgi:uncharacterized protein (UPF0335 family)
MAGAVSEGSERRAKGAIRRIKPGAALMARLPKAKASGLHTEERRMAKAPTTQENPEVGGIAGERLRSIVERIERLEEEKKALSSDIKDIFAEAKSAGFDVKVLRAVIRLRKQEPAEVEEQETLLDLYRRALGM